MQYKIWGEESLTKKERRILKQAGVLKRKRPRFGEAVPDTDDNEESKAKLFLAQKDAQRIENGSMQSVSKPDLTLTQNNSQVTMHSKASLSHRSKSSLESLEEEKKQKKKVIHFQDDLHLIPPKTGNYEPR